MSIAIELVESSFTTKQIIDRATRAIPIDKRFLGASVLQFSDQSQLLMKKSELGLGTYFCVICDVETLR